MTPTTTKNACPVCSQPSPAGYTTCGRSRCQEIVYLRNRARNARPGRERESWEAALRQAEAVADRETRS